MVLRDKQPLELGVSVITQLLRDRRGLSLNAQKLVFRAELHNLIRGQQIASGEIVADAEGVAWLVAVSLISCGFLAHHLAQPFCRFKIIHPEDLLYPGIGDEGSGPFAIEVLKLAHVLQNWPELKAVTMIETINPATFWLRKLIRARSTSVT
jgi:hypothetical protein